MVRCGSDFSDSNQITQVLYNFGFEIDPSVGEKRLSHSVTADYAVKIKFYSCNCFEVSSGRCFAKFGEVVDKDEDVEISQA